MNKKVKFGEKGSICQRCHSEFDPHALYAPHFDSTMVLCAFCYEKLYDEILDVMGRFVGISSIEKGMRYILEGLQQAFGLDLQDENFRDTPQRVARAYYEIFEGIKDTKKQVKDILSSFFVSKNDEMIICKNIKVYSMCPHHFLPVEYDISVAYIPNGKVLGISKLCRLVELLAKRPVLQEKLTEEITDSLQSIDVKGSACKVEGIHFCMKMRGVKQQNSKMITSSLEGVFLDDADVRMEFMNLIGGKYDK